MPNDATDIVERLRANGGLDARLQWEAADEIERLREMLRVEREESAACAIDRRETQRERDDARREVCEMSSRCVRADNWKRIMQTPTHATPQDVADSRGWGLYRTGATNAR